MSEYRLFFTTVASTVLTVEADTLVEALDKAYKGLPGGVCAQCAGWGSERPGIELGGDWELDEKSMAEDYPDEETF